MQRNQQHDGDFDDIVNMMENTLMKDETECKKKKEIKKEAKEKKMNKPMRRGNNKNKKRKTYKKKPKKLGSLTFEELMKRYNQMIGQGDDDLKKNIKVENDVNCTMNTD